jgi:hypothetical protein
MSGMTPAISTRRLRTSSPRRSGLAPQCVSAARRHVLGESVLKLAFSLPPGSRRMQVAKSVETEGFRRSAMLRIPGRLELRSCPEGGMGRRRNGAGSGSISAVRSGATRASISRQESQRIGARAGGRRRPDVGIEPDRPKRRGAIGPRYDLGRGPGSARRGRLLDELGSGRAATGEGAGVLGPDPRVGDGRSGSDRQFDHPDRALPGYA